MLELFNCQLNLCHFLGHCLENYLVIKWMNCLTNCIVDTLLFVYIYFGLKSAVAKLAIPKCG